MHATTSQLNLFGLTKTELSNLFLSLDEAPYRGGQLMKWLFHHHVFHFRLMANFSKTLQQQLFKIATLTLPDVVDEYHSQDGSIKWALKLVDGNVIESVYIPEKNRGTLCISSQAGCALNCTFCATGKQGFNRNLSSSEIIAQVVIAKCYLAKHKKTITNVTFMGMGEPLLNEKAVYASADILLDDFGFGLSRRRLTISTAGIVPAIYRLSDTLSVNLAVSLHATDNDLRDELVPINKKYPICELLRACQYYVQSGTQKRHILFEYIMLKNLNDAPSQAYDLAKLIKHIPAKVNLIPFNTFKNTAYETSPARTVDHFCHILYSKGIRTTQRRTRGGDISAACGQLSGKITDKTNRLLKQKI